MLNDWKQGRLFGLRFALGQCRFDVEPVRAVARCLLVAIGRTDPNRAHEAETAYDCRNYDRLMQIAEEVESRDL